MNCPKEQRKQESKWVPMSSTDLLSQPKSVVNPGQKVRPAVLFCRLLGKNLIEGYGQMTWFPLTTRNFDLVSLGRASRMLSFSVVFALILKRKNSSPQNYNLDEIVCRYRVRRCLLKKEQDKRVVPVERLQWRKKRVASLQPKYVTHSHKRVFIDEASFTRAFSYQEASRHCQNHIASTFSFSTTCTLFFFHFLP